MFVIGGYLMNNRICNNAIQNNNNYIDIQNISKVFGKITALNNISLTIPKGEIFGLLGPSGCGKSTLVKIIAGISKPDHGFVEIFDRKVPAFNIMKKVGYMSQFAALYPTLSGYENLWFFGTIFGMKKNKLKERILEVTDLLNLKNDLKKLVKNYSGGMKQRLSLAITLLPNPDILILDEPTVGIDPLLRRTIWEELHRLQDLNVTIIITTHVMDEVEKCDSIAMIRNGEVLATGTPKEIQLLANTENIEDAFIYFSKKEAGDTDEN